MPGVERQSDIRRVGAAQEQQYLVERLHELEAAIGPIMDRRNEIDSQTNFMGVEHGGDFGQALAVELEILVIGPRVAAGLDRGRGPSAAQFGRNLGQGRQLRQVAFILGRVVVPAHRQTEAADLEPALVISRDALSKPWVRACSASATRSKSNPLNPCDKTNSMSSLSRAEMPNASGFRFLNIAPLLESFATPRLPSAVWPAQFGIMTNLAAALKGGDCKTGAGVRRPPWMTIDGMNRAGNDIAATTV